MNSIADVVDIANSPALVVQLLTFAVLALQRQLYHNRGLDLGNSTNASTFVVQAEYDFIIVGGGTAGCIVASRLSEVQNVSVLLLEAGGPSTITSDMMAAFAYFNYNWGYQTTPQQYSAFGLRDRRLSFPRGRILGGSHAINSALYNRGNSRGYDDWAANRGAQGWSWAEVLPYFLLSENNTDPQIIAANPSLHSTSGPVQVSSIPNTVPIHNHWTNALVKSRWPIIDINGPWQLGTSVLQMTQSNTNWTRQTTYNAYIEPIILQRSNLHVLPNSLVTRLLFQNTSAGQASAVGVEFERAGQTFQVRARREVILSGGVINSPQLLMLSGIGPAEHLAEMNISPIVANLSGVGYNLQDHISTSMYFLVNNSSDFGPFESPLRNAFSAENLADFFTNSSGPLIQGATSETFVATGINGDKDWPDGMIYAIIMGLSPNINQVLGGVDQSNRDAWERFYRPLVEPDLIFRLVFSAFRSVTKGRVSLASRDPHDHPIINPNYFADPRDLSTVVRTFSVGLKVAESEYMKPYIRFSPETVPGCTLCPDRPMSSCISYLVCVAQTMTSTSYHPVGTCSMGNSSNVYSVVDERLRVRKVANLRVIDASVMPEVPNANTNTATMMIAEKGAHMLRQDHSNVFLE